MPIQLPRDRTPLIGARMVCISGRVVTGAIRATAGAVGSHLSKTTAEAGNGVVKGVGTSSVALLSSRAYSRSVGRGRGSDAHTGLVCRIGSTSAGGLRNFGPRRRRAGVVSVIFLRARRGGPGRVPGDRLVTVLTLIVVPRRVPHRAAAAGRRRAADRAAAEGRVHVHQRRLPFDQVAEGLVLARRRRAEEALRVGGRRRRRLEDAVDGVRRHRVPEVDVGAAVVLRRRVGAEFAQQRRDAAPVVKGDVAPGGGGLERALRAAVAVVEVHDGKPGVVEAQEVGDVAQAVQPVHGAPLLGVQRAAVLGDGRLRIGGLGNCAGDRDANRRRGGA
mmetsp:Transcript_38057/g.117595  ORF Transcript_38057/g.117595 Transcript_38057/m.117595 type:complete len:332 (-) Transcript_38057:1004-1999(-)